MHTDLHEWLEVVRREYLQDFIRDGGAAVKFTVASGADRAALRVNLHDLAASEGFLFAAIDAATTKSHMIEHLFHDVARQVDWDELAYLFLARIVAENALQMPSERSEFSLRAIAELNGQ